MTEPWSTVNLRAIGICRTLWVVACNAAVAQDHGGMFASIPTPYAGLVVQYVARERPALGGCGANGVDACSGVRPEQSTQFGYKA